MSVEEMIKRSFSEFSTQHLLGSRDLPRLAAKISRCLDKLEKAKLTGDGCSDIKKGGTGLSNEPTSNRKTKCPIHGLNCDAEGMFSLLEAENEAHHEYPLLVRVRLRRAV